MSAPGITYSGVLAQKSANEMTGGRTSDSVTQVTNKATNERTNKPTNERTNENTHGRLFKGTKFWVSRYVPDYNACINKIQENGGTVVSIEKIADVRLCNPEKGLVPGSYPYHLIQDAIDKGSFDNIKKDYLCVAELDQKKKQTRTKFTKEEDEALIKYVIEQEREGKPTGGNEIYKKFAETHKTHTFQSWRDRWTKRLSYLPREQPPVTDSAQPEMPRQELPARNRRRRFTDEEDALILKTIHNAIKRHQPWKAYELYKHLADEHPERTYLGWRERALNYVARGYSDQIAKWEVEEDFYSSDGEEVPRPSLEDQEVPSKGDEVSTGLPTADHGNEIATATIVTQPDEEHDIHMSDDKSSGNEGHQAVASSPLHRTNAPQISPRERVPVDSDPPHHSTPTSKLSIPRPPNDEIPAMTKEQFYGDYNTFLESTGATNRFIPSIGGKAIALWDLWQSVRSQVKENIAPDWQQVAEDLGFDWVSIESAPNDLQQCYEEHLAPFADAIKSFHDSSDEDSDDDNTDTDEETERPLPSSPPMLPSLKRRHATTSPEYQPGSPRRPTKRRRIDRSDVIPSTPEDRGENLHLPLRDSLNKSPVVSPRNEFRAVELASQSPPYSSVMTGENNEATDRIAPLPLQRQGQKRRLEPETQDFYFDAETQAQMHDEEEFESQGSPSPSQQLILESDTVSLMQHGTPASAAPPPQRKQATPTPRRNSNTSRIRRAHESPRSERAATPTPKAHPKSRALPSSWKSGSPTPTAQPNQRSASTSLEPTPSRKPTTTSPQEKPTDIVDRFISLGYDQEIVERALRATSWVTGNAGQVMEIMRQSGTSTVPQTTRGVWTQRDDDALALISSKTPPADAKEERKRAKESRRLMAKHGDQYIASRRVYLFGEAR